MTASANIPDGFSMGELEFLQKVAAANDAEREAEAAEAEANGPFDGKTQNEVVDIATDLVQAAIDQCNDPMVHKIMMSLIIDNFLRWHTQAGMNEMESGNERSNVCWLRDAGKFQAIHNILDTIACGPHDWTTGEL